MADPVNHLCKGCFLCIQECPREALSIRTSKEYLLLGDSYWTPEIISKNWYQAETGMIPVSGAGYSGPFSGEGFDSMWTDMSEIVRPTRDGIHGREYISTTVDIGKKLPALTFDAHGALASPIPPTLSIPLPIIFNALPFGGYAKVYESIAQAASHLGTCLIADPEEWVNMSYTANVVPRLTQPVREDLIKACKMVELDYDKTVLSAVREVKKLHTGTIVSVRVPCGEEVEEIVAELTSGGVEVIHLYADLHGQTFRKSLIKNASRRNFIKDIILHVHRQLVDLRIRDEVTLIVSGGIASAEHVAKAILCGADVTAIDLPLLIALECRYCKNCRNGLECPIELQEVNPQWGTQRIINLIGAWRNQLLEVLGAMGLREVRRFRGEVGRAIFVEDIQKETFDKVLAKGMSYNDKYRD
jgi:ferredoxin